jgi:putative sterol carrier protein
LLAPTRLEDFFAGVRHRGLVESLPDGVSVTFDLRGEGGGLWTVSRAGDQAQVSREEQEHTDCRLTCSVDDFRALLMGNLHPMDGFVDGRLNVEGDVGLVLRLHRAVA